MDRPDDVYSSHALDILADIYAEEEGKKEEGKEDSTSRAVVEGW